MLCDRRIEKDTVEDPRPSTNGRVIRGQPTCFVTAEVPYPILPSEFNDVGELQLNVDRLIGYRPLVLHSRVSAEVQDDSPPQPGDDKPRGQINWIPDLAVLEFLRRVLGRLKNVGPTPDGVLLRLTLKGNFIWSKEAQTLFKQGTPGGYLDGESFRAPGNPNLLFPRHDSETRPRKSRSLTAVFFANDKT